ncbi:MAG: BrnT family toxin [Sphingopyxis sp.]
MDISFDEAKRQLTLKNRGLDFRDAARFFAAPYVEYEDNRFDYGEQRYIALGQLDGRAVAIIWTPRGETRRIISMRHAHAEEIEARKRTLD